MRDYGMLSCLEVKLFFIFMSSYGNKITGLFLLG